MQLEGKIDAVKENRTYRIEQLKDKISEVERTIEKKQNQKEKLWEKIHKLSQNDLCFMKRIKKYRNITAT